MYKRFRAQTFLWPPKWTATPREFVVFSKNRRPGLDIFRTPTLSLPAPLWKYSTVGKPRGKIVEWGSQRGKKVVEKKQNVFFSLLEFAQPLNCFAHGFDLRNGLIRLGWLICTKEFVRKRFCGRQNGPRHRVSSPIFQTNRRPGLGIFLDAHPIPASPPLKVQYSWEVQLGSQEEK